MLTQDFLKKVLHYNPETGIWTWIVDYSSRAKKGESPGWKNDAGYICFSVKGKKYRSHQLAFLYMEGALPKGQIDHINRIRDDNRWCNLRPATQTEQNANCKVRKNNTSGYRGIYWREDRGYYVAQIVLGGQHTYIGSFPLLKDAVEAYNAKSLELFGDFHIPQEYKEVS